MATKRKRVAMTVVVSVPVEMTAVEARREVRTLINDQIMYASKWEDGDVRAVRVTPAWGET